MNFKTNFWESCTVLKLKEGDIFINMWSVQTLFFNNYKCETSCTDLLTAGRYGSGKADSKAKGSKSVDYEDIGCGCSAVVVWSTKRFVDKPGWAPPPFNTTYKLPKKLAGLCLDFRFLDKLDHKSSDRSSLCYNVPLVVCAQFVKFLHTGFNASKV